MIKKLINLINFIKNKNCEGVINEEKNRLYTSWIK